jgi:hypothetical protein
MRARPAGPAQPSVLHDFARGGPTKEAHPRALNQPDGLLRSVVEGAPAVSGIAPGGQDRRSELTARNSASGRVRGLKSASAAGTLHPAAFGRCPHPAGPARGHGSGVPPSAQRHPPGRGRCRTVSSRARAGAGSVTIRCAQAAGRRDDPISTRPDRWLAGPGRDDPFMCWCRNRQGWPCWCGESRLRGGCIRLGRWRHPPTSVVARANMA